MPSAETPPRGLIINLFGELRITLNGTSIPGIASNKGRALLAYLAVEGHVAHRRERLAEMLWPDREQRVARNSLKQSLASLRKAIGDRSAERPVLLSEQDKIRFNSDSEHCIDVLELKQLIEATRHHGHAKMAPCPDCETRLRMAVALYRGDFLEGFSIPDSQPFEEWALMNRETYRRQISRALRRLASLYAGRKEYQEARRFARQLVKLQAWNEEGHRELIRLLALDGQRSAALRQYEICERMLADEFDVEPAGVTKELYERIRNGEFGSETPSIPSPAASEPFHLPVTASQITSAKPASRKKALLLPLLALVPVGLLLMLGLPLIGTAGRSKEQAQIDYAAPAMSAVSGNEIEALAALYYSTDGHNWNSNSGWISDQPACTWYGVTCIAGSVSELRLSDSNLAGPIPKDLVELRNLTVLELHDNELTGEIPPELGSFPRLRLLDLSFNRLEGEIPPELGSLEELTELLLAGNSQLSGPIPLQLSNLANLNDLVLSSSGGGTQISGTIPPELGDLRRLKWLELANSLLEGPIPPELGNLTNLLYLDLSNNNLTGSLPPELGNLTNMWMLAVGEGPNQLSGPIPLSLTNLKKLRIFQFHETDICEPRGPAFHIWISGIHEVYQTNIPCN
jgi:DNA-binding SARP family transcriptional activator